MKKYLALLLAMVLTLAYVPALQRRYSKPNLQSRRMQNPLYRRNNLNPKNRK